jgi:hypothetical protein
MEKAASCQSDASEFAVATLIRRKSLSRRLKKEIGL